MVHSGKNFLCCCCGCISNWHWEGQRPIFCSLYLKTVLRSFCCCEYRSKMMSLWKTIFQIHFLKFYQPRPQIKHRLISKKLKLCCQFRTQGCMMKSADEFTRFFGFFVNLNVLNQMTVGLKTSVLVPFVEC